MSLGRRREIKEPNDTAFSEHPVRLPHGNTPNTHDTHNIHNRTRRSP